MAEEPHCSWAALCAVIIPSLHCKLPSPITPNNGSARSSKWKSELCWGYQASWFLSSAFRTGCYLSKSHLTPTSSFSPDTHAHINHMLLLTGFISFSGLTFFPYRRTPCLCFFATHTSLFLLLDSLSTHHTTHYTGRSPSSYPPPLTSTFSLSLSLSLSPSPSPSLSLSLSLSLQLCEVRLPIDKGSLQTEGKTPLCPQPICWASKGTMLNSGCKSALTDILTLDAPLSRDGWALVQVAVVLS